MCSLKIDTFSLYVYLLTIGKVHSFYKCLCKLLSCQFFVKIHFCSHFFALHGGVTLRVETVWQTKPPFTTRPSNAVIGDQATCYNFERTKYCSDIFYYNMDWKWWLKWNVASLLNVIRRGHIFKAIIEPVHQSHQDKFILFKQTFANICNKSTNNSYEQKTSKIIRTV